MCSYHTYTVILMIKRVGGDIGGTGHVMAQMVLLVSWLCTYPQPIKMYTVHMSSLLHVNYNFNKVVF